MYLRFGRLAVPVIHQEEGYSFQIGKGEVLREGTDVAIISTGLMVGTFDDQKNFNRAAALGVANYGQMTAGGWMYIGPQGIVHGTFNTLLNAGRL